MVAALIAIAAAVVSVVFGALTVRKDAYERAIRAIDMISEDPVADARHRVGSLVYHYPEVFAAGARLPLDPGETDARIQDVFTLLSGATRLNSVRRSIGLRRWTSKETTPRNRPILGTRAPHRLLEDSTISWVRYWTRPQRYGDATYPLLEAVALSLGATVEGDDFAGLTQLAQAWLPPQQRS